MKILKSLIIFISLFSYLNAINKQAQAPGNTKPVNFINNGDTSITLKLVGLGRRSRHEYKISGGESACIRVAVPGHIVKIRSRQECSTVEDKFMEKNYSVPVFINKHEGKLRYGIKINGTLYYRCPEKEKNTPRDLFIGSLDLQKLTIKINDAEPVYGYKGESVSVKKGDLIKVDQGEFSSVAKVPDDIYKLAYRIIVESKENSRPKISFHLLPRARTC